MRQYEPLGGTHINAACAEAVKLAVEHKEDVEFQFNGVPLVAKPDSLAATLANEYFAECDRRREEYENSPAGKRAKQERLDQIDEKQKACNRPTRRATVQFKSQDDLMRWVKDFTAVADDVGVKFDQQMLANRLEAAGYKQSEFVGDGSVLNTRNNMCRYIIGQCISCLRNGMPPHPMAIHFVEEYFKLKA